MKIPKIVIQSHLISSSDVGDSELACQADQLPSVRSEANLSTVVTSTKELWNIMVLYD